MSQEPQSNVSTWAEGRLEERGGTVLSHEDSVFFEKLNWEKDLNNDFTWKGSFRRGCCVFWSLILRAWVFLYGAGLVMLTALYSYVPVAFGQWTPADAFVRACLVGLLVAGVLYIASEFFRYLGSFRDPMTRRLIDDVTSGWIILNMCLVLIFVLVMTSALVDVDRHCLVHDPGQSCNMTLARAFGYPSSHTL